jgi:flagella basal body P-ring formation protein FlgA
MIVFPPILLAGCLAMNPAADQITAGDLASLFPGLSSVAADTPVAPAPVPGVARVFRIPELTRIATTFQVDPPHSEICIQRPVIPPDPARMLAAMQKELPGARIEILEFSRRPVPEGAIEFRRSDLHAGPTGGYWGGNVRYGGNHLFPIWAKVAVWLKVQRVVALHDLQPGTVIAADAVEVETRDEFPQTGKFPQSADQVVGQLARGPIRAGTAIRSEQLEPPKQVQNGETVIVDVWTGGAHLKLEARAEGSGAIGQIIPVRNLDSQKQFLARIDGKGRVTVGDSGERNFTN